VNNQVHFQQLIFLHLDFIQVLNLPCHQAIKPKHFHSTSNQEHDLGLKTQVTVSQTSTAFSKSSANFQPPFFAATTQHNLSIFTETCFAIFIIYKRFIHEDDSTF
jgi:hypothetical protein